MAETSQQSQAHAKLKERWSKLGFEALSRPEQEAVALFSLEGEVMNGGLHQFFANSSGDLSALVLSGLSRLGAKQTLAQFQSASASSAPGHTCKIVKPVSLAWSACRTPRLIPRPAPFKPSPNQPSALLLQTSRYTTQQAMPNYSLKRTAADWLR